MEETIHTETTEALLEAIEEASVNLVKSLKSQAEKELSDHYEGRRLFEKRLYARWKKALDLYELIYLTVVEIGKEFERTYRPQAVLDNDVTFEVLTRLHARACRVAAAIGRLLSAGYADDAHARWRTLHEINVTAAFIAENGNEIANRYLMHWGVDAAKSALQYFEHQVRLNEDPLEQSELDLILARKDSLVNHFGPAFKEDYGWAAPAFNNRSPKFWEIEKKVQLDHLRPYFKWASDDVHAGIKGITNSLGTIDRGEFPGHAGPSNMGLTDPAHGALISLMQCTNVLIHSKKEPFETYFETTVRTKALLHLVDEAGDAFLEIQQQLESEEAEKQGH